MEPAVKVGRREATLVMSTRRQVRLSGIGALIGSALGEAYGYLGARRVETAGPPFVIYHGAPVDDDPFEVEVCAPIAGPTEAATGWQVQQLPAGTFATMLHVGPYDTIGAAYATLTAWLGAHDLVVMGPPREVYLSDGSTPPEQIRTIIEFPVAEVAAPVAAG
jgi:effector-binding domain-containing protein